MSDKPIFIIGGQGFVGAAYVRYCQANNLEYRVITRETYASFKGQSCSLLINANGNSKKYLANKDPVTDFIASVQSVAASVHDFSPERYIFLSSAEAYPNPQPETSDETSAIDPADLSLYGRHKFFAERYVEASGLPYLIIRQSGFVGAGLQKNAIFDMLNNAPVWLHPDSYLQFNSTDQSAAQVMHLAQNQQDSGIFNVSAPGGWKISDLHAVIRSQSPYKEGATAITNGLALDRISAIDGMPLASSESVVKQFLETCSE